LAFDYTHNNGIETFKDYPYTSGGGATGSCKFDKSKVVFTNKGTGKNIASKNVDAIKTQLALQPVAIGVNGASSYY
jgi:hypothetical protein